MPGLIPGIFFINLNSNTIMYEKRTHSDDRRSDDRRNVDRRVSNVTVENDRRADRDRRQNERRSEKDRRS
jgi:hypothetical protein